MKAVYTIVTPSQTTFLGPQSPVPENVAQKNNQKLASSTAQSTLKITTCWRTSWDNDHSYQLGFPPRFLNNYHCWNQPLGTLRDIYICNLLSTTFLPQSINSNHLPWILPLPIWPQVEPARATAALLSRNDHKKCQKAWQRCNSMGGFCKGHIQKRQQNSSNWSPSKEWQCLPNITTRLTQSIIRSCAAVFKYLERYWIKYK